MWHQWLAKAERDTRILGSQTRGHPGEAVEPALRAGFKPARSAGSTNNPSLLGRKFGLFSGLLAVRSGDSVRARVAEDVLALGPVSLGAIFRAAVLGFRGNARGALEALPALPGLEDARSHDAPLSDAIVRLLRGHLPQCSCWCAALSVTRGLADAPRSPWDPFRRRSLGWVDRCKPRLEWWRGSSNRSRTRTGHCE